MDQRADLIPAAHFRFLEECLPYFEADEHFFAHASYKPELTMRLFTMDRVVTVCADRAAALAAEK